MVSGCVKCGGSMHEGFVLDHGDSGAQTIATWHEGAPRKSFWLGIKEGDSQTNIRTYRCQRCGYLESYAKP